MEEITESGFLQYAASNDIIMVFPQVWNTLTNFGCFDGHGAVSDSYEFDTNENAQVKFVLKIIDTLTAERYSSIWDGIGD